MLNTLGYGSDIAVNGAEALELLARNCYDLVLMDCQMPVMDGYEASRRIREQEQAVAGQAPPERIPIVALTAHALEGDREKALESGMDDYLTKPFTMEQLTAVLDHWLSGKEGPAEVPTSSFAAKSQEAVSRGDKAPPIDHTVLNGILLLNGEKCQEIVDKVLLRYLDTTPDVLDQISAALAVDEAKTVEVAAHSLKSSSGMIGALRLSDLFRNLEQDAREGDLTRCYAILSTIETEYQRVRVALEEVCAE
jgi:CheY-like chemotaxis protein